MREPRAPWVIPVFLTLLMLGMSGSLLVNPAQNTLSTEKSTQYVGLNQPTNLEISSANGSSSALKAEVPVGHTVESVDVSLSPNVMAFNDGFTWSGESDWNASGAILDRINVNQTDGLQLLPKMWEWDFETGPSNSPQGWTLGTGWMWGYDTTLGQSGGVHSGTKAIYTYNGNYPNNIRSTYWATSPAIDCSGCSGNWNLEIWKRLGVEYHYYDHAYIQVKNPQGSWAQIYSSTGTINDGSFQRVTYNIASYVQNNPAFQVRFGLGTTDGSVTYTGWNVDDVSIIPSGGGGGGDEGNWTSARFGPGITGAYASQGAKYGITSIDATIPTGSNLELSVLDGASNTPIPGYTNLDPTWIDLGGIDPEKHPSLRLKLNFDATGGANSPIVHQIHMNHRYGTSFASNPVDAGWSMSGMNWNNGQISGSNGATATSPVFTSHRPLSQMQFTSTSTGQFTVEASLDGGNWQSVSPGSYTAFEEFGSTIQFRISCTSSCSLTDITIEMVGGHLPIDPRFDIGLDGWAEWEASHDHVSSWGWQDRFTNGDLSADMSWTTSGLKQIGMLLPKSGLESFSVDLAPFTACDAVDASLVVGGTTVATKSIGFSLHTETFTLTSGELAALNAELSSANTFWGVGNEMHHAIATLDIQGTSGSLRVGGLSAIHRPSANLSFAVDTPFVISMNQALPNAQIVSQHRMVPLSVQSTTAGAYMGAITDLVTSENVALDGATLSNFSQWSPVTPSWQWMELGLNYSWLSGTPDYLSVSVETDGARAFYKFPVDGTSFTMTQLDGATESPLEFVDESGGATFDQSGTSLGVNLPFQTSASLEDSNQFKISASLYMINGAPSPAHIEIAGQSGQGVENDIQIRDWQVYNELGYEIPESMSYLRSNSPISVEVHLGFEGLESVFGQNSQTINPRSGDVRVHLLENGVAFMNTTVIEQGVARFDFSTQSGTGNATYAIEVEPLVGQDFHTLIPMNRTFTVDSLNPQVVGQNIATYDHRLPSPNQLIQLEIYDRPVLPTDLTLMIWREWVEDTNVNGVIDTDEFIPMTLQSPSDLSTSSGLYTLLIDDTDASDGDRVAGYVVGADPAGNSIVDGGSANESSQLFTYQVLPDGPPLLPGEGGFLGTVDGKMSYLHPGVDYEFGLHIVEPNGWADIGELRLQLASNSVTDTLAIEWSADTGRCDVLSNHIEVQRCGVRAWTGELTPFNPDLEFFVVFQLNWSLPREGDMRWEPSIEVTDRGGQGAWLSMPQLRWRYSPDLAIDTSDMTLSIGSGTYSDEGAWVSPGSTITLSGGIHFPASDTRPSTDFSVRVLLDGQESIIDSANGLWVVQLTAPSTSGSYPLTVEIANPPQGANDVTDTAAALRWIVVDPDGPEVVEILAPRMDSIIPIDALEELQINVQISELEQIDSDSLVLQWKVTRGADASVTPLVRGDTPLVIEGANLAGQSIIAGALLNIDIPEEYFSDDLRFHIWVEGQDMAGNAFKTPGSSNTGDLPFASWSIERRAAVFSLMDGDITYSKSGDIELGQNIMITIAVRNDGEVNGTVKLYLTEVHLDGTERELTAVAVEEDISTGERGLINVDWQPTQEGRQWIRVTLADGTMAMGPNVNMVEAEDSGFLGSVFGGVDLIWVIMFMGLLFLLASVLMIALRSGGSNMSYLDETDDYWEDEDEVDLLPSGASEEPKGFPLDYRNETVRHVMAQHGISDTIGFLQHARGFDRDGNEYLNRVELDQAAASFVAAGSLVQAQVGQPQTFDTSTMSPEQLAWYEQAKQWGGYYDEAGNWVPL